MLISRTEAIFSIFLHYPREKHFDKDLFSLSPRKSLKTFKKQAMKKSLGEARVSWGRIIAKSMMDSIYRSLIFFPDSSVRELNRHA